jgi:hypothetical protein
MDIVLSIIASVASIAAAIFSWLKARDSFSYSNSARSFRDEIVKRRGMIELTKVHAETVRILQLVSDVGPTCTRKSVRGQNCSAIARKVEEYARFINEHSDHFNESVNNSAQSLCTDLKADIEALAAATEHEKIQEAGKSIYYKISAFLPVVKRDADDIQERI